MIISTNWLKKFTDIDMPIDELATLIGARLVEIEEVIDLGAKYKDVVIAKVIECGPLEGSDHLNVTKLDDGGSVKDVERDENGFVQVVCGAPNVRAGQFIAWLPPRAIVPNTYGDAEPFVLGARKLRGVMSNGMIASARELDLFDEHEGILVLDDDLNPGDSFVKVYELDDYLLDIENKSLTHRPDTFGIIGFAREVAAISGKAFKTPKWLADVTTDFGKVKTEIIAPKISIENPELSARFEAVVLRGGDGSQQSPLLIQTYLARVGMRPINALVDATNYLMMSTGQPMGIYDYDKVLTLSADATICVRSGRAGEKLGLLDGRTIELAPEDIVVAAGETAIGLAGAMGAANTVVDATTKNIMIEAATFNLYNLRSTQMRHGIFSEAITRFTKGQPAPLTAPVLADVVHLISEWTGAVQISEVAEAYPKKSETPVIHTTIEAINNTLGSEFTVDEIMTTLQNVEFHTDMNKKTGELAVVAPYWRGDIHIAEDIIEEVGRLNGFDSIAPKLPLRDFTAVSPSDFDELRAKLRTALVRAGANEVLTYSFIHGDILQKSGQKLENSYRITNSISPDLQYYRQSLTPSLLNVIHPNVKQGYDNFAVFELNKSHPKSQGLTVEDVPRELDMLALTVTNKKAQLGSPYYQARKMLDYVGESLGLDFAYEAILSEEEDPTAAPFEYRRSATVRDGATGISLGIVGEYKKSVARAFKLPSYSAGFEVESRALFEAAQKQAVSYVPLSRYPSVERDICFQVADTIHYGQIIELAETALAEMDLQSGVSPIDIYQPENGTTKNITIRIKLTANDRTLTGDEVSGLVQKIADGVIATTQAIVI